MKINRKYEDTYKQLMILGNEQNDNETYSHLFRLLAERKRLAIDFVKLKKSEEFDERQVVELFSYYNEQIKRILNL